MKIYIGPCVIYFNYSKENAVGTIKINQRYEEDYLINFDFSIQCCEWMTLESKMFGITDEEKAEDFFNKACVPIYINKEGYINIKRKDDSTIILEFNFPEYQDTWTAYNDQNGYYGHSVWVQRLVAETIFDEII
jgi:hypothetical protein